jgi:single-strand DNA-binding protein
MLGAPRGGGAGDSDSESTPQRSNRAPAAQKAKTAAGGDDFEDFPGALQDEDDDLPF